MTGVLIHFSNSCKNDKRNSNLFFNNKQCKNEIQIRFSKWCESEKRKLKFASVFQSEAKTKKETGSSNPFFKVKRKGKTKSKIQICFSMSCENEKWIWHLIPFSHAIEKRLALRYTHSPAISKQVSRRCINFPHELTCQILTNQNIKVGRRAWSTRDSEKSQKRLPNLHVKAGWIFASEVSSKSKF